MRDEAANLTVAHRDRPQVLGVDPKLILVFELGNTVDPDDFRRSQLSVLDASERLAVVAFADDPQLAGFLERVDAYTAGAPVGQAALPYEAFLDAITRVRVYGPEDRITRRLEERLASAPDDESVRLDIECWHPGDADLAVTWLAEVRRAIEATDGRVTDDYIYNAARVILLRAYVPAAQIPAIATLDQIARIDDLPSPRLSRAVAQMSVDELPTLPAPLEDAPIVALIDSGVRSAHPLIAPALLDATTVSGEFADGEDGDGHGTRVASILLHGSLEEPIRTGVLPRPVCRLLSIRVLGDNAEFPQEELWEKELDEAIRYGAAQGARIFNLSIGDAGSRYRGAKSTPVAAILDQLAKELALVIVVSAGNVPITEYSEFDEAIVEQYPVRLANAPEAALLDPAPAALALTVGSTCVSSAAGGLRAIEPVTLVALGQLGWPSPFSRHGPGVGDAVKPELVAPGGSLAYDLQLGRPVDDREVQCLTAGGLRPESLLDFAAGTSLAAPFVTRIVAAVAQRYPAFGANLVKALVLQGVREPDFGFGDTSAAAQEAVRNLMGFGHARLAEAVESNDHRAVLVAEGEIPVDGVHVYDLPMPTSFFEPGGSRRLSVALSFDPDTRGRRLDYLSSKMSFHIVRGLAPEEIESIFLEQTEEELEKAEEVTDEEATADGAAEVTGRLTPSKLGARSVKLSPPPTVRSRGTNQLGRRVLRQRLPNEHGTSYFLVVKNTNQWAPEESSQSYALCVVLHRDEDRTPIYAELQARIEVPVEVELRR